MKRVFAAFGLSLGLAVLIADVAGAQVTLQSSTATQMVQIDGQWDVDEYYEPGEDIGTNYTYALMNTDVWQGYSVTIKINTYDYTGLLVNTITSTTYIAAAPGPGMPQMANGSLKNDYPTQAYSHQYTTVLTVSYENGVISGGNGVTYYSTSP